MTKRWDSERKKEHYYKQAKRAGYRSRSAYKLKQINDKFKVISRHDSVIDLGAAPGGWSQVVKDIVGPKGVVVGVDLQRIEPIEGINFIQGDVTRAETLEKVIILVDKVDVVVSDMSPNITGNYSMDHARSIELAEGALEIAKKLLKENGNIVIKIFQGDLFDDYLKKIKAMFTFTKIHSPKASRKSSSEVYIIGKGFKGA
jgi:23S rRNA (uridine2552-2'-O)-methyltransferase